jgi:hypothetical protein
MKRFLLLFVFAIIASIGVVTADDPQGESSILLTQKIDNPIGGHGNLPKGDLLTVYAGQNGHELSFCQDFAGCLLTLSIEDSIVYSTCIPASGIVSLPSTLFGVFEISLYTDVYCFVGEITL